MAARDSWLEAGGVFVTTDYVADERLTLTLMRMRLGLEVAEAWWQQMDASQQLEWESVGLFCFVWIVSGGVRRSI